jgi:hypothetical protein
MLNSIIVQKKMLLRPVELCRRLSRLRLLTPALRREFFG